MPSAADIARLDEGKRAKSSVEYGRGAPAVRCGICRYYRSPGQAESLCRQVKGLVESYMTCVLFEPRNENKP